MATTANGAAAPSLHAGQGDTAGAATSSSSSTMREHPGAAGVQHRKRDMYSENKPIPSIQRFLRRGLTDALRSVRAQETESETDEEPDSTAAAAAAKAKEMLSGTALGSRVAQHGQAKEKEGDGKTAAARQTDKSRLVHDPITQRPIQIHDVGKREYRRAMRDAEEAAAATPTTTTTAAEARRSQDSARSSPMFVQSPVMGAMPFGRDDEQAGNGKRRSLFSVGSLRRRRTHGRQPSKNGSIFSRDEDINEGEGGGGGGEDDGVRHRDMARKPTYTPIQNVLTLPFPPLDALPAHVHRIHPYILPLFAAWAVVTLTGWLPRVLSVLSMSWLAWWAHKTLLAGAEDRRWERERVRGQRARQASFDEVDDGGGGGGIKEGAEWLNAIMQSLWTVMNPELFGSMGATLEDVMQASIPSVIHAVKMVQIGHGTTPVRLTGFRVLPDSEAGDLRHASQEHMRKQREEEQKRSHRSRDADSATPPPTAEDAGSTFMNLELSFVYRARPSTVEVASKTNNAHMLIKFWLGARKLVSVPLPVWVEVKGVVGSVRLRIQLTPDPPFVKNVTFTFMGLPRVGVEVIPLHINTANIPLLAGFVQGSVDAALAEYVAPSSMTMDVGEIMMGDNIKREVDALGVVVVYIHRAADLEKQDVHGSSDPYCTVQMAKHGKVLYATRVALDDLSPRWEERYVILITPDAVQAREKVSVGLWDSDRFSADDMLGRTEVDLFHLVARPGRLFRRTDTLVGLTQEMKKQGLLHWSVGFFPKAKPGSHAGVKAEEVHEERVSRDHHEDTSVPRDVADLHLEQFDSRASDRQTRNIQHAVAFEAPSQALPSGILSMQVHQIAHLEVTDTRTQRSVKRGSAGAAGQEVDAVESQDDKPNAPSAYVTIILNDETVFRSRSKALSSNPFYNAGTERYVRDWRRALCMFVVYDQRLRESDAILGVVPIKLTDVFTSSSQITSVYPIAGGVGRGHLRVSLLFRPIAASFTRHIDRLGWDIGTMRIVSSLRADGDVASLKSASIRAYTLAGRARLSSKRVEESNDGAVTWRIDDDELPIKVPVRRRFATPFVMEFRTPLRRKPAAMCILWMQDVGDDDVVRYTLPIWRTRDGGDFHRLLQNYHDYENEDEATALGSIERAGYLHVTMQFKSGVGKVHTKFDSNPDAKVVMDAWRACTSVGLRSVTGDFAAEGGDEGEDSGGDDSGDDAEEQRERVVPADGAHVSGSDISDDSDDGEHDNGDDDDPKTALDKLRKWNAERRELHRQHRGMQQYKSVRTAAWIGRGIRDRGTRAVNSMRLQERRAGEVETEL